MKHALTRLLAALTLAAIPLGPAAPVAALNGCYTVRNGTQIWSRCTGSGHQYQYIQTWVKCGTSAIWTRGNRIGDPWYLPNGLPKISKVDCAPFQPREWVFAYWLYP